MNAALKTNEDMLVEYKKLRESKKYWFEKNSPFTKLLSGIIYLFRNISQHICHEIKEAK